MCIKVVYLQTLIYTKKYFTLKELNSKIGYFDYGVDVKNKPTAITEHKLLDKDSKNLHQNGKSCLTLNDTLKLI